MLLACSIEKQQASGMLYSETKEGKYVKSGKDKLVLVAIIKDRRDFEIARNEHWYRIPRKTAPEKVKADFLAFYQPKVFGDEKWAINYYAETRRYDIIKRAELLPDEKYHKRANDDYYKIEIDELQRLEKPIISRKLRRVTFIPTTYEKFTKAEEINDLFNESPLEDKLWYAFKEEQIEAERQEEVRDRRGNYRLDFAIYCRDGKIDVECNGDKWHAKRETIPKDNARNNFLTSRGWSVLRFSSREINGHLTNCLDKIKKTINQYGGISSPSGARRLYELDDSDNPQLELFTKL